MGDDNDAENTIDGGSNTEVDSVDDLQICLEGFLGDLKRVPDLLAASTVFSMVKFGYSMVSDYVHMDEVLPENLSVRAATTKGRKSKNKRAASKISGDSVQTDTARVAKATGQGTPQKKPRNASKCSKCKSEGHNRKTCPQEGMLPPNPR
ncbi:hypothetical protein GQ54DRAFT_21135 [Martensiomyces pterosporus]|nr:hypothetical protein GQ54DRAFT_21135 [Martensiomyces pterosporus]